MGGGGHQAGLAQKADGNRVLRQPAGACQHAAGTAGHARRHVRRAEMLLGDVLKGAVAEEPVIDCGVC